MTPSITDLEDAPEHVIREHMTLRAELDRVIPSKTVDDNLIIATWNIRHFGDLTEKWDELEDDDAVRDLRALLHITEIVSRFDVVAIQEVSSNIRCMRRMLRALGPHWGLLMTDETKGRRGNNERLAFVFDTRKVNLSGLAGELVIPDEELRKAGVPEEDDVGKRRIMTQQFARTPYAVGFRAKNNTFVLVTVHMKFKQRDERTREIKAIADWIGEWAKDMNSWEHNLIALGDFNIDREGGVLYDAFVDSGLDIHEHFHDLPRTLAEDAADSSRTFYDQIAWFKGDDEKPALSLRFLKGGNFDFRGLIFADLANDQLKLKISDHFPLWAEFEIDPVGYEELPTFPVLTREQKDKMKEKEKKLAKLRRRNVLLITELDNAFVVYLNQIAAKGFTIKDKAEKWFSELLFRKVIVEEFRKRLKESEANQTVPRTMAVALAEQTAEVLKAKTTKKKLIELDDLKKAIRELNEWPFLRARAPGS
ncbi:MAG: endonuclease/exonuclease/phosphatase family protein [Candidatus Thorarchaeota archaeon]|jgi:endonuclease/exonuclease/phosphatase family metal-dependent hydrolase